MPHHPTSATPLHRRDCLRAAVAMSLAAMGLSACNNSDDEAPKPAPAPAPAPATAATQAAQRAVAQGLVGAALGVIEPLNAASPQSLGVAGVRTLGQATEALQLDDWMDIGSNGKAMTAMVIARLVEQGRMSWTWRVADVLPELAAQIRSDYAGVTLAQWLDHQGGVIALDNRDDEARFVNDLSADPNPLPDTLQGRRRYFTRWVLQQTPPEGVTPGQDFLYSNAGYMIAATLAEAVTGLDFEALLQAELITPLGLAMDLHRPSARPSGFPTGYEGPNSRELTPQTPLDPSLEVWYEALAPSGSWACTPRSYTRWLQTVAAALRGETTPLPTEAVTRLRNLPAGDYALGWTALALPSQTVLFHTGYEPGFTAKVVLDPQGTWAAFGLTNTGWSDPTDGSSWVQQVLDAEMGALARAHGHLA